MRPEAHTPNPPRKTSPSSMIPIKALSARMGKVVCVLHAYIDESYDSKTFCVGGWLAPVTTWSKLEKQWQKRIEHEQRMSVRKGFPPITRYHSTDLASGEKEFSDANGWNAERRLVFDKKILDIVGRHKPTGIVIGGDIKQYLENFTGDKKRYKKGLYYFSMIQFLVHVGRYMKANYPKEKVSVFYAFSSELSGVANKAFSYIMNEPHNADIAPFFFSIAAATTGACVPLQSADLIAYEGLKRIAGSVIGKTKLRRPLLRLNGYGLTLVIGHFTDKAFKKLIENDRVAKAKA